MRIHADHPPSPLKLRRAYQPYRKKPYVARWYEAAPSSAPTSPPSAGGYEGRGTASDGKLRQRNKFFASAAARDEFIEQLKLTAQRQDPVLPTIAPHQLIRWQQAMAIAPEADPVEVFKFWKAEQRKIAKLGDRYLQDAAAAYLQSRGGCCLPVAAGGAAHSPGGSKEGICPRIDGLAIAGAHRFCGVGQGVGAKAGAVQTGSWGIAFSGKEG